MEKHCKSCDKTKDIEYFSSFKVKNYIYHHKLCNSCRAKYLFNYNSKTGEYYSNRKTKSYYDNKNNKTLTQLKRKEFNLKSKGCENLKKKFVGSCDFNFNKNEKYKSINSKTFISSDGRCLSLNSQGYFKERIPFKTNRGTLQVSFVTDDNKPKTDLIAYMVLRSFIGGYYKQRRIRYINGDKTDCRLINLEWLDGFQNGIDSNYLEKLKEKDLEVGDKYIKYFFLHRNEWLLMQYIANNKMFFKNILYNEFRDVVDLDTVLEEIYIRAKKDLDKGKFIPLSKKSKKYKENKYDRLLLFLRVKCLDFLYSYSKPKDYEIEKYSQEEYIEIDDYDMFYNEI